RRTASDLRCWQICFAPYQGDEVRPVAIGHLRRLHGRTLSPLSPAGTRSGRGDTRLPLRRRKERMRILVVCLWLLVFPLAACGQELRQLPYNHPGLKVDLGVGLWAWPVPCDADGDGDYDLIVSCPDKP